MKNYLKWSVFAATMMTSSVAQAIEVDDFDLNGDRQLSRSERAVMKQKLRPLANDDSFALTNALVEAEEILGNPELVPVAEVKNLLGPNPLNCNTKQRVFLRDSLRNIEILDCPERRQKSGGASISYVEDFEKGGSSASIKGVAGYVLFRPGDLSTRPSERGEGPTYTDLALAAFAEANGTLNFESDNDGYTRFGLEAETWIERTGWDQTVIDLATYYQSDLDFETHSYGAELRITPVHANIRLNSYLKRPDSNRKFLIRATGIADVFVVADPGDEGIGDNDEYLWLGGRLGAVYEDKVAALPNGFKLEAETLQFWDALSGKTANYYSAGAEVFLNKKQTTSLKVAYSSGQPRQTLKREERVKVNLVFKH